MKKSNILLLAMLGVMAIVILIGMITFKVKFKAYFTHGDGNITEQVRDLGQFESIKVTGNYTVFYTQNHNTHLKVTADANLLDLIKTEIHNEKLVIESSESILSSHDLTIEIYNPTLSELEASASARFFSQEAIEADNLMLLANSGAFIEIEGNFGRLDATQNAGSTIKIIGSADTLVAKSNGGGLINAYDLLARYAIAEANAGARINVNAAQLEAKAYAAGNVNYTGNPIILHKDEKAGGRIRSVN